MWDVLCSLLLKMMMMMKMMTMLTRNLIVDIEQHEVITARYKEVLSCSVGVYNLVLWPIED